MYYEDYGRIARQQGQMMDMVWDGIEKAMKGSESRSEAENAPKGHFCGSEAISEDPSLSEWVEVDLGRALSQSRMQEGGVSLKRMAEIAVDKMGYDAGIFAKHILQEKKRREEIEDKLEYEL